MRLGICDDEQEIRKQMKEICDEVIRENNWDCEIVELENGEEVLEEKTLDLLILDIDMPGMSGIDVKKRLQKRQADTIIIFVTFYQSFVMDAFGINVHGFVSKGKMREQLPKYIESAILIMNDYIVLENGVRSKDIMYIEAQHVYANMILKNGECKVIRKSMDELEKILSDLDFVRTHRSYIVNLEWVCGREDNCLWVGDKQENRTESVPIAFRRKTDVKLAWEDYVTKLMHYKM